MIKGIQDQDLFSCSLSHTLTITCTCCYDVIKGTEDLKIYSHADSHATLTLLAVNHCPPLATLLVLPSYLHAVSLFCVHLQGVLYEKGRGVQYDFVKAAE